MPTFDNIRDPSKPLSRLMWKLTLETHAYTITFVVYLPIFSRVIVHSIILLKVLMTVIPSNISALRWTHLSFPHLDGEDFVVNHYLLFTMKIIIMSLKK